MLWYLGLVVEHVVAVQQDVRFSFPEHLEIGHVQRLPRLTSRGRRFPVGSSTSCVPFRWACHARKILLLLLFVSAPAAEPSCELDCRQDWPKTCRKCPPPGGRGLRYGCTQQPQTDEHRHMVAIAVFVTAGAKRVVGFMPGLVVLRRLFLNWYLSARNLGPQPIETGYKSRGRPISQQDCWGHCRAAHES